MLLLLPMGFSGNLVAFGFEDDIIIYEKLVEVIDNILVGDLIYDEYLQVS